MKVSIIKRGIKPEHAAWVNMNYRCSSLKHPQHKDYIGRGITVCSEWKFDFERFLADMGPRPKGDGTRAGEFSLERIDNNGNYEPSNCRWASRSDQMLNRRDSTGFAGIMFSYNGVTQNIKSWANSINMHYSAFCFRLSSGWTLEDAVTKPIRSYVKKI